MDAASAWRYLGVGRWLLDEGAWGFPAPSLPAWRALSSGRTASRSLCNVEIAGASKLAGEALARLGEVWLERGGQRGRVLARAPQGGLRIAGADGGFAERTVSLLDLAWALAAHADVQRTGGVPDEARVNRLRYLDGTLKGATRWIDTGWALAIVSAMLRRPPQGPRKTDGQ